MKPFVHATKFHAARPGDNGLAGEAWLAADAVLGWA